MDGIAGAEGMDRQQLMAELARGGRVVRFDYAISVVVLSFARTSAPRLVRAGQSAFLASLPYTLLTLLFGWWGVPFGPIFTVAALVSNAAGGKDVTHQLTGGPSLEDRKAADKRAAAEARKAENARSAAEARAAAPPPRIDVPTWREFKQDRDAPKPPPGS